jgi:TrmH family RNA methyltransferase
MPEPQRITSRNNPLLVKVRKLAHDPGAYRKLGQIWIEGDHLCDAAVAHGACAMQALVAESAWHAHGVQVLARSAARVALLPDTLFDSISALDSPARIGFVIAHDTPPVLRPGVPSVVLDRVQDPGNVGSIVRSAAALGVRQLIALEGTAALWSPKALRAGMGAHFALSLLEGLPHDRRPRCAGAAAAGDQFARRASAARGLAAAPLRMGLRPRRAGRSPGAGGALRVERANSPARRPGVAQRRGGGRHLPVRVVAGRKGPGSRSAALTADQYQ